MMEEKSDHNTAPTSASASETVASNDAEQEAKTLICLGCGYTAQSFAARLMKEGWRVIGTTRNAQKAETLKAAGIEPLIWAPATGTIPKDAIKQANAVLISTPPSEKGCPAFSGFSEAIRDRGQKLSWIGYLSTNGVYGDHQGDWVDEEAMLYPTTARAHRRIKAEADWVSFGVSHSLPVIVFRLPGIYGPGRSALDTVRAGKAKRIYKQGQMFSRAHVDDIAAALKASLENPQAGDLFNICDDEPAPPQDVIEFACELLGAPVPPLTPLEEADLSEMGRSFYQDSKRVKNSRMKAALGVQLSHPTYRDGLSAILNAERQS